MRKISTSRAHFVYFGVLLLGISRVACFFILQHAQTVDKPAFGFGRKRVCLIVTEKAGQEIQKQRNQPLSGSLVLCLACFSFFCLAFFFLEVFGFAFPFPRNIFRELAGDIRCAVPTSGDLTAWAERDVLLLNTSLTVEAGKPNSHANWGGPSFVGDVLRVCAERPQPIVFLLRGGYARAFAAGLQLNSRTNKAALCSSYPSPLGAAKGNAVVPAFPGSRPSSGANRLLRAMGGEEIDWML